MGVEVDAEAAVDAVVDVESRFLLDLSGGALFRSLMLVPLALGEAVLVPHSNHQDLGGVAVEDDGSADGLILHEFAGELLGVDADGSACVLLEFEEELVALLLPLLGFLLPQHFVQVVVEGLLSVVAQPVGLLSFLRRQVQQELADYPLEQLPLASH